MTDPQDGGNGAGQPPAPFPPVGGEPPNTDQEALRQAIIQQVANETRQLLAIVGVIVPDSEIPNLLRGAETQLEAQANLAQTVYPTFRGGAAQQYPLFLTAFSRAKAQSVLLLPGQPPAQPYVLGSPKLLAPTLSVDAIALTLAQLAFLTSPIYRLAAVALGLNINFQQSPVPPQQPSPNVRPIFRPNKRR